MADGDKRNYENDNNNAVVAGIVDGRNLGSQKWEEKRGAILSQSLSFSRALFLAFLTTKNNRAPHFARASQISTPKYS